MNFYDRRKPYDLIMTRKHKRSLYLALSVVCKELITRPDNHNSFGTRTFTEAEIKESIAKMPTISVFFDGKNVSALKFLVLALRNRFQKLKNDEGCDWRLWMEEAQEMVNLC